MPSLDLESVRRIEATYILVPLFFAVLCANTLFNYVSFQHLSGDIAIFAQSFFNTLEGSPMVNSFEGGSHLGVHFSPVLYILTPVMAVFQSYPALMIANGLLTAIAFFWFYRHLQVDAPISARIVLIMLMSHATLMYDAYNSFHALSMMSLPFVGVFIAHRRGQFSAFLFWLAALATIRENLWILIASWGFISYFTGRQRQWIIAPIAIAMIHFVMANLIAPAFFEAAIQPGIRHYFLAYGQTPSEIMRTVATDPLLVTQHLFTMEKARYILGLSAPFLVLLPFLRWRWLLPALPTLTVILLSSDGRLADPKLHYSVEIVWWFAIATAMFLTSKETRLKKWRWSNLSKALHLLFIFFLLYQLAQKIHDINTSMQAPERQAFLEICKQIDRDDRVIARRPYANQLSWRRVIFFLHETEQQNLWNQADCLLVTTEHLQRVPSNWQRIAREEPFHLFSPPNSAKQSE